MKKLFFIFAITVSLLALTPSLIWSQTVSNLPNLMWQKMISNADKGGLSSLTITVDNHYILTSSHQDVDSYQIIYYLDNQGNLLWQKNINMAAYGLANNGCIELNNQSGFIVIVQDSIIQFDYQGNIVKITVVPTQQSIPVLSVFKDQNYYYVAESSNLLAQANIFIYDNGLNLVRTFSVLGGTTKIVSLNGYLYIANSTYGGGITTNVSSNLSKYDTLGNFIWTTHLPDRFLSSVCLGNDSKIYFFSMKMMHDKPYQTWETIKYDTVGNLIWSNIWYGDYPVGSVGLGLWPRSVVNLPSGGCIVFGAATELDQDTTSSSFDPNLVEAIAIAYDISGNISWKMRLSPTIRSGFSFSTWDKQGYLVIAGGIADNGFPNSTLWKYSVPGITAVRTESSDIPTNYFLSQNYPNPFNPSTTINFSIIEGGFVSLKIYDLIGREVATLVNEELSAGVYNTKFDASQLASGVYVYRLTAKNFTSSKKMMLMK